ncbi:hypothetical protein NUSPORA_02038 [Nucleospora cyclopteri]
MEIKNCIICFEDSDTFGFYDCNHKVCLRCAAKLVYFYNDLKCSQCNKLSTKIVFSKTDNLESHKIVKTQNAHFDCEETKKRIENLLLNKCKNCKKEFKEKRMLSKHYKFNHKLFICEVCLFRKFSFWDEIKLYDSYEEFKRHRKRNHIFCPFCEKFYFDLAEIRTHCRNEHQICTICDVMGKKHQYFRNYDDLERHFRSEHYCCTDSLCIKNHCFAFAFKSEIWGHYKEAHKVQRDLNEIRIVKYNPDPKRCDLSDSKGLDANKSPFAITTGAVRILNPYVKENPSFPGFLEQFKSSSSLASSKKLIEKAKEGGLLPEFLANNEDKLLMQRIRMGSKNFQEEIFTAIKNYSSNSESDENTIRILVKELEEILEEKMKVYNLLYSVCNKDYKIRKFLHKYMEEIKFPRFETTNKAKEPEIKKNQFKIIDLSVERKKKR